MASLVSPSSFPTGTRRQRRRHRRQVCHQVYIPEREVIWTPPKEGYIKLNFDGGLLRSKSCAISAGIFRDHLGVPIFSYGVARPGFAGQTPYDGEANALLIGLCYARSQRFHRLRIEGDAKFLIDVLEGRRTNDALYDEDVLDVIRKILAEFPKRPDIQFIHREGNMAADALVKVLHDHPKAGDCLTRKKEEQLPMEVAKVVDRERRGHTYLRKACSYTIGPF